MSSVVAHIIIRDRKILLNGNPEKEILSENLEDFLLKAYSVLGMNYPKFYKMDFLSQAGIIASDFLANEIKKMNLLPEEIAMVLSNKSGSTDTDLRFQKTTETMASPALFVYTLPNIVAGEISIRHGIKGESAFFVTPDFKPELIVPYVESLFSSTSTKVCIAGWTEVIGESHHIFLYLASKEEGFEKSLPHTIENIRTLYYS